MHTIDTEIEDILAFQEALIIGLNNELIVPIEIHASDKSIGGIQCIDDIPDEVKKTVRNFTMYAVIAGIGHYSAMHDYKVGLLTELSTRLRRASDDEAQWDVTHSGGGFVGRKISELSEPDLTHPFHTEVNHRGILHEYTGPPRFEKSIFSTKVYYKNIPSDISALADEVSKLSPEDSFTSSQGFYLFHVDKGNIIGSTFRDSKDIISHNFGKVFFDEEKLMYSITGEREKSLNLSDIMYKP